jgi:Transcriptional regulator
MSTERGNEGKPKLRYTTILHDVRMKLGITMEEYAVCDLIHNLQSNPRNTTLWCYASKEYIAETLGLSRATVFRILNRVIEEGLIERHADTKQLRTTPKWFETVIPSQVETDSLKLRPAPSQVETPNRLKLRLNNKIDNYNYINTPFP